MPAKYNPLESNLSEWPLRVALCLSASLPLCLSAPRAATSAAFRSAVLGAVVMLGYGHGSKYGRPAIASVAVSGFKNLPSGLVPAAARRRPPATAQPACASNAESCSGRHAQRRVPLQDGDRHAQDTASRDSQPPCSSRSHATATWAGDISVCLRAFQRPIADRASAGVCAPSCRATQCTVASSSMP